jgi:hypothetical protein
LLDKVVLACFMSSKVEYDIKMNSKKLKELQTKLSSDPTLMERLQKDPASVLKEYYIELPQETIPNPEDMKRDVDCLGWQYKFNGKRVNL